MRLALLLPLVAGCLEVPKGAGQECNYDSDCNTASGEVCDEGLCYGNPPTGNYAGTLSAPIEREDLISTEIPLLSFPVNGHLPDLELEAPVTFSGRVEAYCPASATCPTTSIAAEVRLTRPSRFPGGPALRLSAQSKAGVPRGTDSFSILLPRTHEGDEPYTVTIDGDGGGEKPAANGGTDPAELVPPKRLVLYATDNLEHQTYSLGGANPVVITGVLKDALGGYLTSYRVVALGRWDTDAGTTEVSTVDYVTNGQYSITLSEGLVGPIELVAKSFDPNVTAPELHVVGVLPSSQMRNIGQPTGLGSRVEVTIPIKGVSAEGPVEPVSGARVIITGRQEAAFPGAATALFTQEVITGDDGLAKFALLDGMQLQQSYRLRVIPPASSDLGVVFGAELDLQKPAMVQLPKRVKLRGRVLDVTGQPLADVSVTARRSLRFLWSLDSDNQEFLDEIPAATAITQEAGDFVVWVDPALADAWAFYDLSFKTPTGSSAPSWMIPDFQIPRLATQTMVEVNDVVIPDGAYVRGKVVDPAGNPVEGSALRVFLLPTTDQLCYEVTHAPDNCSVEATVMGDGESDMQGIVRLDLPRP
ncbi:MAG TPA: hypothetical protein VMZ53_01670 [Kofleriaceae bacterium]|nr:hypothetical protein [Kofleriaceae bacterium]